jgi:seryl-tRNA synthetase
MTQEKLEKIKKNIHYLPVQSIRELIPALETAWAERDDTHADRLALACQLTQAIRERDELRETVKVLSERLAEVTAERDEFEGRLNDIYSVVNLGVASPRT